MKRIHPLMASRQSADYRQPWQMSGVWRRSINFVAKSGELLTLHRRGSGFSPGGWILRGGDFDALRDVLTDGEKPAVNRCRYSDWRVSFMRAGEALFAAGSTLSCVAAS